ncbi:MAG: aminotransferase class I/II-fold pyridoxal phosphate-dependent enzyme [Armatimonadota bacterium]|nr:aminotransferase class I/II-fold pyridoxal phosphate-dependent enzyme [Armatimonadota bacterium]MDR7509674.1 aminotransferase class I/II-fold pyridoxal phosphate-dependent enzyme [Armatimonadota bacterium]MDR7611415.1 aminotransferase class I/II-fold pyridoxal phosphate-dependent enzyme [Armatimonadota bacterium]
MAQPPEANPITRRVREFAGRVRRVQERNLYLYLQPVEALGGAYVTIGGRQVLLGSSYSYLGLLGHPAIEAAVREAARRYGSGTHGVRLLAGNTDLHDRLERRLAACVGAEAAVAYSSGYVANVACISTLVGRGDLVVADKLDHASIIDGCLLSGARLVRVPHNNIAAVDRALQEAPPGAGTLVVVDAVFSMDGDVIDLPALVEVCRRRGAWLMVDESHSLGVLGPDGRGIQSHFGLPGAVDIVMSSLSKSIPSVGGFIAGGSDLVDLLKHASRAFVFSAALPPPSAAASLAALDIMEAEPQRVARLHANLRRLRAGLRAGGLDVRDDPTPIVPVITGSDDAALRMARRLFDRGVFVPPIVTPAVPPRTSRLRVTVTAAHTEADVDRVVEAVVATWREVMVADVPRSGVGDPGSGR